LSNRDAYVAIADPRRREILDLLYVRQIASAGEIAASFRGVSRPAISRHLRVLRECGVVISFRSGKTQNYALNPEPIKDIHEDWLEKFSAIGVQSLVRLKEIVELG
jgi:DNA-binding transcriptional ArsR family regulator